MASITFMHGFRLKPGKTLFMGPEESADHAKQERDLKWIRGNFLEVIIEIESHIDNLLERFFLSKKSKFKRLFQATFLNSRNSPIFFKIEVLKRAIEQENLFRNKQRQELFVGLERLIVERNKWAHGKIFYEQKPDRKLQSYLEYINSKGEICEQELTNRYFDDLNAKLKTAHDLIQKLLVKKGLINLQKNVKE